MNDKALAKQQKAVLFSFFLRWNVNVSSKDAALLIATPKTTPTQPHIAMFSRETFHLNRAFSRSEDFSKTVFPFDTKLE